MKDTKTTEIQKNYIKQIVQFYGKNLPSNQEIVVLQHTPQYLIRLGAKQLPIIIKQSTLNKCIRSPKGSRSAHSLGRTIIENIPNEMESPIMVIKDKARDTLVLICHGIDQNKNPLLIPLQLNNTLYGNKVNEIKSIYGKTALQEYLIKNEEKNQIYAIDIKKAAMLSPSIGFQLPQPPTESNFTDNIPPTSDTVKDESEKQGS